MSEDIVSGSICFCFSLNLRSAAQFVVYGHLTALDNSLSQKPNWCHHPLITQLTPVEVQTWLGNIELIKLNLGVFVK